MIFLVFKFIGTGPRRPLGVEMERSMRVAAVPEYLDGKLDSLTSQQRGDLEFIRLPTDDSGRPAINKHPDPDATVFRNADENPLAR